MMTMMMMMMWMKKNYLVNGYIAAYNTCAYTCTQGDIHLLLTSFTFTTCIT